ncbi:MAG: DUF6404 family protein [Pseudomonadota bacterium]
MNHQPDYEQRLAAALAELERKGVSKRVAQPPYFRLARRFDLEVRPPYYASFGFNAIFSCIVFTLLWGVIMWILVGAKTGMQLGDLARNSLNVGLIVGLVSAVFCYSASRFHKLTAWESLIDPPSAEEDT